MVFALTPGAVLAQAQPPAHLELVRPGHDAPSRRPVDLEALFVAHASFVSRLLYRLVGREGDVEDLVQEVFVQALRRIDALRDPGAARAWLSQVAVRLATRRLKRRRFRRFISLDDDEAEGVPEFAAREAPPEAQHLLRQVFDRLDAVGADDRVAWTLRVVEERPLDEVAELCGCSLATAKRRIARVEAHLAEVFHE